MLIYIHIFYGKHKINGTIYLNDKYVNDEIYSK